MVNLLGAIFGRRKYTCRACNGKGCESCNDRGWITRAEYFCKRDIHDYRWTIETVDGVTARTGICRHCGHTTS